MFDKQVLAQAHPAFRFVVLVGGQPEGAFVECVLPTVEWETDPVREGGLNVYTHQLPGRRKPANITLKNGVGKHSLLQWYLRSMSEQFETKSLTVLLLDVMLAPAMVWQIEQALPVRWTGPQLQTATDGIAIQTLEFACGEIRIVP